MLDTIRDSYNNYVKGVKFNFLSSNGEIWNPVYGWQNLVEDAKPDFKKLCRQILTLHFKILKKDRTILLYDSWSAGYFHWIADVLPKLFMIKEELDSWDIVLPKKLNTFQKESLLLFDLKQQQTLESWETGICTNLHLFKLPWKSGIFNDDVYLKMSRWIVEEATKRMRIENGNFKKDSIFISRQKANSRRISNYEELLPLLKRKHFLIAELTEFGFFEQVLLFSKARVIAGAHGAGLVNMMFMERGGIVIEFRNSYPEGNNCYERLARLFNHRYIPLLGDSKEYNGNFQMEDIAVNLESIMSSLKEIIKTDDDYEKNN